MGLHRWSAVGQGKGGRETKRERKDHRSQKVLTRERKDTIHPVRVPSQTGTKPPRAGSN